MPRLDGDAGFSTKAYMPKHEPKTKLALSVFNKAKAHIKDVERAYKQTERKKQKLIEAKDESNQRAKLERDPTERVLKSDKPQILLTPIQEMLLEHVNAINSKAALIEENNVELKEDV